MENLSIHNHIFQADVRPQETIAGKRAFPA